jgi:hypothetical protein
MIAWKSAVPVLFACVMAASLAHASGAAEKSQAEIVRETLWQAFNLVVILAVMIYFGRKPISDFFTSRRQGIQTQLSSRRPAEPGRAPHLSPASLVDLRRARPDPRELESPRKKRRCGFSPKRGPRPTNPRDAQTAVDRKRAAPRRFARKRPTPPRAAAKSSSRCH